MECKIGKLYDQRHGVKSHTHVVFDVVDFFLWTELFVVLLFIGTDELADGIKIPAVRQTATEEIFFNMFLKQNVWNGLTSFKEM